MESLDHLVKSIPEWQLILEGLDDKIARRQKELAAAADNSRPSTRSLRNKGSTESLRQKDDSKAAPEDIDTMMFSTDTPQMDNEAPLFTMASAGNGNALSLPTTDSTPQGPKRSASNINRAAITKGPALTTPILRKRKTESIASTESGKPKHRTRSMIIVYYDSAVQADFETLVKNISTSRNSMRKGKMAARMASMRRMAELEAQGDEQPDLAVDDSPAAATKALVSGGVYGSHLLSSAIPGDEDDDGLPLPALKFVSTRRMGPMRELSSSKALRGVPGGVRRAGQRGTMNPSRQSALGSSIFDELDGGLEWSQSMCERAAHQFLRDGRCTSEIEGIRLRLREVWERAEQERKEEENIVEAGTKLDLTDTTEGKADSVSTSGEGRVASSVAVRPEPITTPKLEPKITLKPEPQLPRTLKQIQIRKAAEKMLEKAERTAQKPAQKSLEKATEKPTNGLDVKSVKSMEKEETISVDYGSLLEADDNVMDEDDLRNEYAAIIARNSNYRRRPNVY